MSMRKNKKVLVINPYLNIAGGGERHVLSIAQILSENEYAVDVSWNDTSIKKVLTERLGIDTSWFSIIPDVRDMSLIAKTRLFRHYEKIIYVTDGSYFFSPTSTQYIYSMYPLEELYSPTVINKLKWRQAVFVCISQFTEQFVGKWTNEPTQLLYPYIDESFFKLFTPLGYKKKQILSVGRFFGHLHSKNHGVLIDVFNELQKSPPFKEYELHLVGGLQESDRTYYDTVVEKAAANKQIIIHPNESIEGLHKLYKESEFYWHAAGFGVDEMAEPHRVEHFGITPLEAMSAGSIVFCHNSGGPKELITPGKTGVLYDDTRSIITTMNELITNRRDMKKMQKEAYTFVTERFNYKIFRENVERVMNI